MVSTNEFVAYRIKPQKETETELKPVGLHIPVLGEGTTFDVPLSAEYKYKNEGCEEYITLEYICTINNERFAMNDTSDNLEHVQY